MEKSEKGARFRPPRKPPTAVGTAPRFEGNPAPAPTKKIIAVTGPTKNVGKSTIALNLAAYLASSQERKVSILAFDLPSYDWMKRVTKVEAVNLNGIASGNDLQRAEPGIGVVEVRKTGGGPEITPERLREITTYLNDTDDIIFDIESSDLREAALSIATHRCWILTPESPDISAHLSDDREDIIVFNRNLTGVPGLREDLKILRNMHRSVSFPEDAGVKQAGIENRIYIQGVPPTEWFNALSRLFTFL